jgi:hypothetical protein
MKGAGAFVVAAGIIASMEPWPVVQRSGRTEGVFQKVSAHAGEWFTAYTRAEIGGIMRPPRRGNS